MNLTFRQKIVIPVLFLVVTGLFCSGVISHINSKKALQNSITKQIESMTESVIATMEAWIQDRYNDAVNWSGLEACKTSLQNSFVGKASRAKLSDMFLGWKKSYRYFEDIALANASGEIVASSAKAVIGKINVSGREYFKSAMAGTPYVSKILTSKNSGNPVFFISSPVKGKKGIEGVLFTVVDLNAFCGKFVDTVKVEEKGYAYMTDYAGLLLSHPDKGRLGRKERLDNTDYGRRILEQKNGLIDAVVDGRQVRAAFRSSDKINAVIIVQADSHEIFSPVSAMARFNLIVALVITLVASMTVYFMANRLVRPINQVVAGLKDAAEGEGDLTKRLDVLTRDELGDLANWFNVFVTKVQDIIRDVSDKAGMLNTSSSNLSDIALQMNQAADQTSGQTRSAADSSRQVSENMNAVAVAMDEAAGNIHMVSAAAEEMSATISEIAVSSEKGREIATSAVAETEKSSAQIGELAAAAGEIDTVVETITDISEQVNLLSLNATIEAARAGEAGKGFAVVANEIKALAQQTADATGEIKTRVQGMQMSTDNTISQIQEISRVVNEVNEIISTIAAAVEEQSATTSEIARNVSQASSGINEVNEKVSHTSDVVGQISGEIEEISQSTGGISGSSAQVTSSAKELSDLSDLLAQLVGRFKV